MHVFHQVDLRAEKQRQGTGLGLALVKQIVEAQGGNVGVQSEPGKGSVFYAVLPRLGAHSATKSRNGATSRAGLSSGMNVRAPV